jgi:hypothetical protein
MCFQLKLLIKKRYLAILLSIILLVSINTPCYKYIALGKENNDEDNENNDNNLDNSREDDIIEKDEKEDEVPFILPFNAVPFP